MINKVFSQKGGGTPMPQVKKSESVPQAMEAIYQQIIALTDEFSKTYLNAEYAQLIRYATAALCRKRPSPLVKGKINTWACGLTYAIGFVNFLFDRSQEPSLSAADLCGAFGVSNSTGAAKAKVVRETLNTFCLFFFKRISSMPLFVHVLAVLSGIGWQYRSQNLE